MKTAVIGNGWVKRKSDVLFVCEECKEEKLRRGKEKSKRFCSRACTLIWRSREVRNGNIDLSRINKFGSGPDNPNWAGGVTTLNEKLRRTKLSKAWRKTVYERDNYTCTQCGQRGGDLNAHHIKEFSLYPELRYEINNGKTLCLKCHRKTFKFYRNQYVEA